MALSEILAAAGAGAAGNIAGSAYNQHLNLEMMNQQMKNEKELQQNAYNLNQQAQSKQASIMVHGMENAGLNPAMANGAGAPSLQAGAAAGGNTTLANIFTGVADLINAAKAPTEIEKATAERELAEAEAGKSREETKTIQPTIENIKQQTSKLAEDTKSAKNMNDVFKAKQEFIRDVGAGIFDGYRANLQAAGQWEQLPYKTKDTIDALAEGYIDLDIGSLEALDHIIDTQGKLSERDAKALHNMLDSIITMRQIGNDKVMKSYEMLPRNQQVLMLAQTKEYMEMAKQAKTQADLNKLEKWLKEHTSDEFLIEHGMKEELQRRKWKEIFNRTLNLPFNMLEGGTPAAVGGAILKGGAQKIKPQEHPQGWTRY